MVVTTVKKKILKLGGDDKAKVVTVEHKQSKEDIKKAKEKFFTLLSLGTELGFTISLPIVIGVLAGTYLDNKLGTGSKFTLSLIFLGVFLGIMNMVHIIKESS